MWFGVLVLFTPEITIEYLIIVNLQNVWIIWNLAMQWNNVIEFKISCKYVQQYLINLSTQTSINDEPQSEAPRLSP